MISNQLEPTLSEPLELELETRTGALRLRQASFDDARLVAEFLGRLDPEDLRFRFLDTHKGPRPADVAAMLNVDHRRTEHVLAFDAATGELAGSLMILADQHMEAAEVAIAVAKEFKGKGIGWALLKHAADLARERGIKRLHSVEDLANHDAVAVEHALGFRSRALNSVPGLVLLEADLA